MSYLFDIKLKAVKMYLSAIEYLYSREIIDYKISDWLDISFIEHTLTEAFKKAKVGNLIIWLYTVIKDFIINQISISLYLRNMELNKICQEKEVIMTIHALKISFHI